VKREGPEKSKIFAFLNSPSVDRPLSRKGA
jgi:hypothetical protein